MENSVNPSMAPKNGNKTSKTLVVILTIVAILLAVASGLLLRSYLDQKLKAQNAIAEKEVVVKENQSLLLKLDSLDQAYIQLASENKELEAQLEAERKKIEALRREVRGKSGAASDPALKARIQELETNLQDYTSQVELLKAENAALASENQQIRTSLKEATDKTSRLEKDNVEMAEKIKEAAALSVSNLKITALRDKRKGTEPTTKAKKTNKFEVCFTVNKNMIAEKDSKDLYVRIINPEGQVMSVFAENLFEHQGEQIQYSIKRTISFTGEENNVCVIWNQNEKYKAGTYTFFVFAEGNELAYGQLKLN